MNHGRLWGGMALLAAFASSAFAAPNYPAVPGEFVIKLKPSTHRMTNAHLAESLGGVIKEQINREENLLLVQRPVAEARAATLKTLAQNPLVEYAEPNYIYTVSAPAGATPTDGRFEKLWGLKNTGGIYTGDHGAIRGILGVDIDAERAWSVETGSRDVVMAIIDTGVDWSNPDLLPNIYTNETEERGLPGVDDDANGFVDDVHGYDFANRDGNPMDVYGHGTHVAGTIGAVPDNGDNVVGVAWNIRMLPIRFLDDKGGGTLANAVFAIDYATKMGVSMMNNSWGGGAFSQSLLDAITRAKDRGILFLAAAGNLSNDNDKSPLYPASYQVDNIISVAAVDPRGALPDFSNYGKTSVHIAAPGVNVLSHTMRGMESWSGTSMACPHVAGVAALLLSQDMTQSYLTIKDRLLASAKPMNGLRNRVQTGLLNGYHALTNTVAPPDPSDPYNWAKDVQAVSTNHPYDKNMKIDYTFTVSGAQRMSVYFTRFETESGYDKVTFKDAAGNEYGTLSGNLGEIYGPAVPGDTVIMTFSSDDSVNAYGFDVGGIAYQ